jgi:hypothetical protein
VGDVMVATAVSAGTKCFSQLKPRPAKVVSKHTTSGADLRPRRVDGTAFR